MRKRSFRTGISLKDETSAAVWSYRPFVIQRSRFIAFHYLRHVIGDFNKIVKLPGFNFSLYNDNNVLIEVPLYFLGDAGLDLYDEETSQRNCQ